MALDPNIILGVNPDQGKSPNSLLQVYSQMQQLQAQQREAQQAQQAQATQNSLKAILSDPDSIDPETGLPKPSAIGKISQIDPQTGLKLFDGVAQAQNTKAQAEVHNAETFVKKNTLADEARSAALESYDNDLKKGIPEPQAKLNAQAVYGEGLDGLKKSGIFSKQEADAMPTDFDPVRMRANSAKYQAWKEKQKADDLAAQKEADADKYKQADLAERIRNDDLREHLGEQKINVNVNAGAPAMDPESLDYAAQRYRETGVMPQLGRDPKGTEHAAIIKRAAEMAKADGSGASGDVARAADTKAVTAGIQNLGKMRASVEQAEGNASKEADLVLSLTDKGGLPGGPSALGKWVQGSRTGVFNDPDASKFQTAVESLKNEYVKVLSTQGGMSGGVSSDAARREADHYINPRLSKAQIRANIEVMRQSMKNRTAAINEAYETERKRLDPSGGGGGKKLHYDAQGNLVQ